MTIGIVPPMKKGGFTPFSEVWSSNGTSTVPAGNPQWATIVAIGGGACGPKSSSGAATNGGEGGFFVISSVNVVGISQLNIVVGKGGGVPTVIAAANAGQNSVVRYTNSTGTVVALATGGGQIQDWLVRTDYANTTDMFIDTLAGGGAGGSWESDSSSSYDSGSSYDSSSSSDYSSNSEN